MTTFKTVENEIEEGNFSVVFATDNVGDVLVHNHELNDLVIEYYTSDLTKTDWIFRSNLLEKIDDLGSRLLIQEHGYLTGICWGGIKTSAGHEYH